MSLFCFDNEQQWLEVKAFDLTSTEVSALLGVSEYKSRFRLWNEKSGLIENDFEDNPFTKWGRRLQNSVALGICEDEGWKCYDLFLNYAQIKHLKIGASMDHRVVCEDRGVGLLEIKTTSFFSEQNGWEKDKAPIDYECQLQTQLHVCKANGVDFDFGAIGALDGRKNTKIYFRKYDPAFGEMLEREAALFWESVEKGTPPDPDYIADGDVIEKLMPETRAGEKRILTGNEEAEKALKEWQDAGEKLKELRKTIKELEDIQKAAKNNILRLIGDAETVKIGNMIINTKEQETADKVIYGSRFRRFDVKTSK